MPVRGENSKAQTSSANDAASASGSSASEDGSSLSLPIPPDGGWGWVVVGASFMVHLIADGCAFSFGVLYVELLHYFKESKGKTAWVGSLFVSVPLITGPIASALTNKYGCRKTTIVGAIIATVGFVASSYATSIGQLCFTFGIIAGFGLSMVYVPAVVIVAYYFEKKRAFATGMAVAGSGIGTFVFAPLTKLLIDWYTWKGAVLLLGGLMLNIVVCGALFRPLVTVDTKKQKNASKQLSQESQLSKNLSPAYGDSKFTNGHAGRSGPLLLQEIKDAHIMLEEPVIHSLVQFPTYLQKAVILVSPDLLRDLDKRGKTFQDLLADPDFLDRYYTTQSLNDMSSTPIEGRFPPANADSPLLNRPTDACTENLGLGISRAAPRMLMSSNGDVRRLLLRRQELWEEGSGRRLSQRVGQVWPMQRKDIFYRGSLVRPRLLEAEKRAASCPDIVMQNERSGKCTPGDKHGVLHILRFSHEMKLVLLEMMDVAILRSGVFVYFCISCMILYMWYDVPYVYSPDKAIKMGMSEGRASFLVAIIGITSTIGQVIVGFIGDRPGVDALQLYNALTTVAGLATMSVPLLSSYLGMAVYAACYGFFISANYALTTIILVELLGMEKLTNGYGLVMLAEGLSNLIGPPLAGFISDYTGSYDETFYIAGAGIVVSGLMLFAIPVIRRYDQAHAANRPENASVTSLSFEELPPPSPRQPPSRDLTVPCEPAPGTSPQMESEV